VLERATVTLTDTDPPDRASSNATARAMQARMASGLARLCAWIGRFVQGLASQFIRAGICLSLVSVNGPCRQNKAPGPVIQTVPFPL